ncbi:MAG TPA: hypothetical protein VE870_12245 [Bacteroidales bacterium]|nr:hypothetical protein [Bacteroidales bacterium]
MKFYTIIFFSFILASSTYGQNSLLTNDRILKVIYDGLTSMYSYDFDEAHEALDEVRKAYPDHPVTPFFEGLITYWEHYPLIPGQPEADRFTALMEDCVSKAEMMLNKDEDNIEGVFFDLFGRAFYVMFWSDNGKPGKVFPYMNQMYKETIKGFELKDVFNEFYFTCGLYNYYIEVYPDIHPVYKPVAMLFRKGNRYKGLKQLQYCSGNSVFLRVEARLFLALIYLNYENDIKSAQEYAASLYREFPKNPYYTGIYLEILLYNQKYFFAPIILDHLSGMNDEFARMLTHLYNGLYLEKAKHENEKAADEYRLALSLSKKYGAFADHYNAIAWMGLGRYYKAVDKPDLADNYYRKAKEATSYKFILNDR